MNIFIHHDGAIGDVLLSLPAIRHIKKEAGRIHFAGRPDIAGLLKETCVVDETSSSGGVQYASLYEDGGGVSEDTRAFLKQFSRAFIFTVRPDSAFVHSIRAIIPNTQAVVTIPPNGLRVPAAEFRLNQIGRSRAIDGRSFLTIPGVYQELASGMLSRAGYDGFKPLVAFHPGSGGEAKRWPLDNFLTLAGRLIQDDGHFVMVFTGPAENEHFKDRVENFTRGRLGMIHFVDSDLIAVAALIDRCTLYIGNDSGISHLAAALGRRVLALFGPTDPAVWKPAGPRVDVIHSQDMAKLTVDSVYARVRGLLAEFL